MAALRPRARRLIAGSNLRTSPKDSLDLLSHHYFFLQIFSFLTTKRRLEVSREVPI